MPNKKLSGKRGAKDVIEKHAAGKKQRNEVEQVVTKRKDDNWPKLVAHVPLLNKRPVTRYSKETSSSDEEMHCSSRTSSCSSDAEGDVPFVQSQGTAPGGRRSSRFVRTEELATKVALHAENQELTLSNRPNLPDTITPPSDARSLVVARTDGSGPPEGPFPGRTTPRRGRGPAKNKRLEEATQNNVRLHIDIPDGYTKPSGDWAAQWTTELGLICRRFSPITGASWKDVKQKDREMLYERVKEKFDIDTTNSKSLRAINEQFCKAFRNYRSRMHQHYKQFSPEEARLNPYDSLGENEWSVICDRFESKKFKALSAKNAASRAKMTTTHAGGSMPFVRHLEKMRDKDTGSYPSAQDFYEKTHKKKSGEWCVGAETLHVQMVSVTSQQAEEASQAHTSTKTPHSIFKTVLGSSPRSGYLRGMGYGYRASASSPREHEPCQAQLAEVMKKAEEDRARAEEDRARDRETINSMQARINQIEDMLFAMSSAIKPGFGKPVRPEN